MNKLILTHVSTLTYSVKILFNTLHNNNNNYLQFK